MKFVILLCALSALLLHTSLASPVNIVERQARAVARQQAPGANDVAPVAAQTDEEDDDDDDDDDDPDLGDLVDDDDDDDEDDEDDDDEEEDDTPQGQAAPAPGAAAAAASNADDDEEDDDDDDYLDRLFDDILGDDDEEDDDEDASPAASAQNTIASSQPASPIEDIEPIAQQQLSSSTGISDGVDLPAESGNVADPAPVGNSVDEATNAATASSNNEGGLKNNIIDMSSDAFQERHNQFIDSIFSRINRIVADNYDPFVVRLNTRPALKEAERNAAANGASGGATKNLSSSKVKNNAGKSTAAATSTKKLKNTKSEPRALVGEKLKSTILSNGIAGNRGRTDANSDSDALSKTQTKLQQQLQQLQNLKAAATSTVEQSNPNRMTEMPESQNDAGDIGIEKSKSESVNVATASDGDVKSKLTEQTPPEVRTVFTNEHAKSSNAKKEKSSTKAHKSNTKKTSAASSTSTSTSTSASSSKLNPHHSVKSATLQNAINNNHYQQQHHHHHQKLKQNNNINNNNKNNNNNNNHYVQNSPNAIQHNSKDGKDVEKLQKAEGSLSGLASLKRVGNVKVIADPEGRNSTIKAKFTLGPLMLRVEKSFKRGSVRSVKSATARTNEMIGRIKFSVIDDRAMLMSIKVQQPKQVEVESKGNNDRTREFIWHRTPKIAKLVNEKLKLAAESLFSPQGVQVVQL